MVLALRTGSDEGQLPKEGCFVLTDQRILHIPGGAAEPRVQSALLRDVAAAEVEKQSRYMGLLLAAGFVFIIGIPFEVALTVPGAFSGAVSGAVLLLGGSFLAGWWYSGGDTIVRVTTGNTQFEGLVASKRQREASDFVDSLLELRG
ncbi:MAG: hypothetical protein ACE5Q6_24210 [Dehalococcoidia bacterium]